MRTGALIARLWRGFTCTIDDGWRRGTCARAGRRRCSEAGRGKRRPSASRSGCGATPGWRTSRCARAGAAWRSASAPGDRVAMLMHDSAELAAMFLGAMRMGAVPVPITSFCARSSAHAFAPLERGRGRGVGRSVAGGRLGARRAPRSSTCSPIGGAHPGQLDFSRSPATRSQLDQLARARRRGAGVPTLLRRARRRAAAVAHDQRRRATHFAYAEVDPADSRAADRVFTADQPRDGVWPRPRAPVPAAGRRGRRSSSPARTRPRTVFDVLAAFEPTLFAATPSLYGQLVHDFASCRSRGRS